MVAAGGLPSSIRMTLSGSFVFSVRGLMLTFVSHVWRRCRQCRRVQHSLWLSPCSAQGLTLLLGASSRVYSSMLEACECCFGLLCFVLLCIALRTLALLCLALRWLCIGFALVLILNCVGFALTLRWLCSSFALALRSLCIDWLACLLVCTCLCVCVCMRLHVCA